MPPAKVGAQERVENPIAAILVLIGADPIEVSIEVHVPHVSHAATVDFQLRSIGKTSQDAAFGAPVIGWGVVSGLVRFLGINFCFGRSWRVTWRTNSPKIGKRSGRNKLLATLRIKVTLRVPFAHVESSVRGEHESMQCMFQVAESSIDAAILVSDVVAVDIPNHSQIGRIGDPKLVAVPG